MISVHSETKHTNSVTSPSGHGMGDVRFRTRRRSLRFILLSLILALALAPELMGQWLNGYCYRKQITILESQIPDGTPLTDFPVLIDISGDNDLRDESHGGYVNNSNGWDLVFTSSDGTTLLDHEVEQYDEINGDFRAWVKVADLDDNNNTVIYLYFGYDTPVADPSTSNTWSNGYVSVYHLEDMTDATTTNNGISYGTADIAGQIGQAEEFDNNDDSIAIGTFGWDLGSGTLEMWASTYGNAGGDYIFGHTSSDSWADRIQLYFNNGNTNLNLGLGNSHTRSTSIVTMNPGSWYHIVVTWDGTNYEVFINGHEPGLHNRD